MNREEFQKTVSERFQNTESGFGNMTQRERILLQIASNEYEKQVKNCSIPDVRLSLLDKVKEIAFGGGSAQERMVDIKALFDNEA